MNQISYTFTDDALRNAESDGVNTRPLLYGFLHGLRFSYFPPLRAFSDGLTHESVSIIPYDVQQAWSISNVLAGTEHNLWHQSREMIQRLHGDVRLDTPYLMDLAVLTVEADRFRIRRRLNHLKALEDGWADGMQRVDNWGEGYGKAPIPEGLDWLANQMENHYYDSDLPRPYLYPTPEGGVQIEWRVKTFGVELEIDLSTHKGEWFCTDLKSDDLDDFTEEKLDLNDTSSWQWVVSQLRYLSEHTP